MKREEALKEQVRYFPEESGVYMMKDSQGKVLYVGKAKNLRKRVSSYFLKGRDLKSRTLIAHTASLGNIVTSNEFEALLLENNLVKEWQPRYNISLKDGKSFPVIRVTNEPFPRVFRTRDIIEDGSSYYGPFAMVKQLDLYMEMIKELFPLRRCREIPLRKRKKPCLYYSMGCCSAPCAGKIDEKSYRSYIKKIKNMLAGRAKLFEQMLESRIKEAAQQLAYEEAAHLRDLLLALRDLLSEQSVVDFNGEKRDYLSFSSSGTLFSFSLMQMRGGKLLGQTLYRAEFPGTEREAITDFIIQYYSRTQEAQLPETLFVPLKQEVEVEQFFIHKFKKKVICLKPVSKKDLAIMAMCHENSLREMDSFQREQGNRPALEALKTILNLPRLPHIIEGIDISQLKGKYTTASIVSFKDGNPDRKGYRKYKIASLKEGQIDDFSAVREVVSRRMTRILNEKGTLPDLLLIDGGKGQVNSAYQILKALELDKKVPVVGLAKREEIIVLPGNIESVNLPDGDPSLRILQYVRNESHRFATGYGKSLRKKELILSRLENVPGIGPQKGRQLLHTYGSLEGIYQQRSEEIAKTAKVSYQVAETVKAYLEKTIELKE